MSSRLVVLEAGAETAAADLGWEAANAEGLAAWGSAAVSSRLVVLAAAAERGAADLGWEEGLTACLAAVAASLRTTNKANEVSSLQATHMAAAPRQ